MLTYKPMPSSLLVPLISLPSPALKSASSLLSPAAPLLHPPAFSTPAPSLPPFPPPAPRSRISNSEEVHSRVCALGTFLKIVSIQFDFPIFILKGKVLLIEEEETESGTTIKYEKMELELQTADIIHKCKIQDKESRLKIRKMKIYALEK
jgi:hypothetical protein